MGKKKTAMEEIAKRLAEISKEKSELNKEEKQLKQEALDSMNAAGVDSLDAGKYIIRTKQGAPSFGSTIEGMPASKSQSKLIAEFLAANDTRFVNSTLNKPALYDLQQKGDKDTLEKLQKYNLELSTKTSIEVKLKK